MIGNPNNMEEENDLKAFGLLTFIRQKKNYLIKSSSDSPIINTIHRIQTIKYSKVANFLTVHTIGGGEAPPRQGSHI